MNGTIIPGRWTQPDVWCDPVDAWTVAQNLDTGQLVLWRDGVLVHSFSLPPGTLAFPRMNGNVIAWRNGVEPNARVMAVDVVIDGMGPDDWSAEVLAEGDIAGNDPIAINAEGRVYYQERTDGRYQVFDERDLYVRDGAPTGLSRVLHDGSVRLVDEDRRLTLPSGIRTRPCWTTGAVAVEGDGTGVEVWRLTLDGSHWCPLWPGRQVWTPRISYDATRATWHVVAWGTGPDEGLYHAALTEADFVPYDTSEPPPPCPPDDPALAPGIDVLSYPPEIRRGEPATLLLADRHHPGTSVDVTLTPEGDHHLLTVAWRNTAGEDRTGRRREVRIVCPDAPEPPDPPTEPPTEPEGGTGWVPARDEVRRWRGGFLTDRDEPWGFMYPAWPPGRRAAFRARYTATHGTPCHLPIGIWGAYGGERFDFRADVAGYRAILRELLDARIIPCVMAHTDALDGGGWSPSTLETCWRQYVPQVRDLVPAWSLGWEVNEIDRGWGGWWTWNGEAQQACARTLRGLIGDALLYAHWSPERWAGRPHYAHEDDYDEMRWWRETPELDGILYQEPWQKPLGEQLARALEIPSPHGWSPGIAGRIVDGAARDFVLFEFARDPVKHQAGVARLSTDPRVKGWC